jgi:hypothetical protein
MKSIVPSIRHLCNEMWFTAESTFYKIHLTNFRMFLSLS